MQFSIQQLNLVFQNELDKCNDLIDNFFDFPEDDSYVREVFSVVKQTPGKRLRPLLAIISGRFSTSYDKHIEHVLDAAAMIELTHTASLIHDDIVDNSELRRGFPTIQSRYGKNTAVYIGDLILSSVMKHSLQHHQEQTGIRIAETVKNMCCGELTQTKNLNNRNISEDAYWQIVQGKTATLFSSACYCGAMEAALDEKTCLLLADIGNQIGVMFQLRDDILDFYDTDTGKPAFQDIRNGIYTYPLIIAMQHPASKTNIISAIDAFHSGQTDDAMSFLHTALHDSQALQKSVSSLIEKKDELEKQIAFLPEKPEKQYLAGITHLLTKGL